MIKIRYIYKITSPTNNSYIGKTDDFERRMREYANGHGYKGQPGLKNSVEVHGWDAHKKEIIWQGICTDKQAYRLEKFFIKKYNTYLKGLNGTPGGIGILDIDDEAKERLRISREKYWSNPENLKKHKERYNCPKLKARQRQNALNQFADPEKRQRHKDSVNTPEYKKLQSKIQREKWQNEEYREKMKLYYESDECKETQRKIMNEWYSDPENKQYFVDCHNTDEAIEHHRQAALKTRQDPEFIAKMDKIRNSAEYRQSLSDGQNRRYADPVNKKRFVDRMNEPDFVEKQRQNALLQHKDPVMRARYLESIKCPKRLKSISNKLTLRHAKARSMGCAEQEPKKIRSLTKLCMLEYLGLNHWDEYKKLKPIQLTGATAI